MYSWPWMVMTEARVILAKDVAELMDRATTRLPMLLPRSCTMTTASMILGMA